MSGLPPGHRAARVVLGVALLAVLAAGVIVVIWTELPRRTVEFSQNFTAELHDEWNDLMLGHLR